MDEIVMTPDACMQFLVWSYYYHGILPEKNVSYKHYGKFSDADIPHLDNVKDTVFKCFEETSVRNACKQFQLAKERHEPCPFPQDALDKLFAKEISL